LKTALEDWKRLNTTGNIHKNWRKQNGEGISLAPVL